MRKIILAAIGVIMLGEVYASKLVVLAPSGLNMRSEANLGAKKVTKVPYEAIVETVQGQKIEKEIKFKEKVVYDDSPDIEYNYRSEDYAFKIGDKYGAWIKVKYGGYTGWVFSGWLGPANSSIEADKLVMLNSIPNNYFKHNSPAISMSYDCFGGIGHVFVEMTGDKPVIWHDMGQDGQGYTVKGITSSGNTLTLDAEKDGYGTTAKKVTLVIKKISESRYSISGLYGNETTTLIPVQKFNSTIVQECTKNP